MSNTRSETPEDRMAEAQKRADEARSLADAAERALSEERQRLAQAAEARQQAWATAVVDSYPAESAAAAEAVASARAALGRAVLEDWPGVGPAHLAWRRATSAGNALAMRYARARSDLQLTQPTTLFPNGNLDSLPKIIDVEMARAVRIHDGEREDAFTAELEGIRQGRWEAPFGAHLADCPGGALEAMTSTKPGPVREVRRRGHVDTERGPATTLTTRRCLSCGGQEVTG